MITLPNTTYKASDISLSAILNSTTKVNMLTVLKNANFSSVCTIN